MAVQVVARPARRMDPLASLAVVGTDPAQEALGQALCLPQSCRPSQGLGLILINTPMLMDRYQGVPLRCDENGD